MSNFDGSKREGRVGKSRLAAVPCLGDDDVSFALDDPPIEASLWPLDDERMNSLRGYVIYLKHTVHGQ